MFFLLGLLAGLVRAELRLPAAIYDSLSMLLLLTIGLKGGIELAKADLWQMVPQLLGVLLLGLCSPCCSSLLRLLGGSRQCWLRLPIMARSVWVPLRGGHCLFGSPCREL